jgi:hypothetical protein
LRFSVLDRHGWRIPRTIAHGTGWFVNWADFPSVVQLDKETLAAHWLKTSGPETYAYDIALAFSTDAGKSWRDPITLNDDGTQTEHGFVSLLPWQDGKLFALWLDGRNMQGAGAGHDSGHATGGAMTLRYAILTAAGAIEAQDELDARVCDCCQTAAVAAGDAILIAYRDRSADEIRDIAIRRYTPDGWRDGVAAHDDGWKIDACPVNGPALAASGDRVAIAWFTGADDEPRVNLKLSRNGGKKFGAPIRIDGGRPLGRVDLALLPDGTTVVMWMEHTDAGAEIRLRRVDADGEAGDTWTVAAASAERASGFPRLTATPEFVVLAWTDVGAGGADMVKTALVPVTQLLRHTP